MDVVEVLFHDRLAFLDDPGDAVAVLAAHLLVEAREHLLQALDLPLGFLEVRSRTPSRSGAARRRLGQFRQRLGELPLGVVRVAELVDECVVQRACVSHDRFSFVGSY